MGMGDTITWQGNVPGSSNTKQELTVYNLFYRGIFIPKSKNQTILTFDFPFDVSTGETDIQVATKMTDEWGNRWPFNLARNNNVMEFSWPIQSYDFTIIHSFSVDGQSVICVLPGDTTELLPSLSITSSVDP